MADIEKIVIITRKTALDELVEKFNTREQARFYIEHMGGSFADYQAAHDAYQRALAALTAALPRGTRSQRIDRSFLPTYTFGERDLVVTLGPDGLVVNTAKYLAGQPLLAFNPDPRRIDGVLVPFAVERAGSVVQGVVRGSFASSRVSMARAELNDGQSILAVNDLFIGQQTHVSARYRIRLGNQAEDQSSSGIIVSTGAGSTGWLRSILAGAAEVVASHGGGPEARRAAENYRFDWDADTLTFSVREPFVSKVSAAGLVFGQVGAGERLEVISHMPQNGVIFSDGVEADRLEFNSGAIAQIGLAERKVNLVVRA